MLKMENDKFPDAKEKSIKQVILFNKLLQSKCFSKKEFEYYKTLELEKVQNSYHMGLLISLILSQLRFRRVFQTKKQKAHLKCLYCGSKTGLMRCFNIQFHRQKIICIACDDKQTEYQREGAEQEEINSKRVEEFKKDMDFEDVIQLKQLEHK